MNVKVKKDKASNKNNIDKRSLLIDMKNMSSLSKNKITIKNPIAAIYSSNIFFSSGVNSDLIYLIASIGFSTFLIIV